MRRMRAWVGIAILSATMAGLQPAWAADDSAPAPSTNSTTAHTEATPGEESSEEAEPAADRAEASAPAEAEYRATPAESAATPQEAQEAEEAEEPEEPEEVEIVSTPIYRVYNPASGEHLLTSEQHEMAVLEADGWNDEGTAFTTDTGGNLSVHRLYNRLSGEHHYTSDENEIAELSSGDWNDEGESFRVYSAATEAASIPVYRLFSGIAGAGGHHLTASAAEHAALVKAGWHEEGIAFWVVAPGVAKAQPAAPSGPVNVYRVYNPESHEHLYTTDAVEVAMLVLRGWNDEGIGWRSPSTSSKPVYRLYNPVLGDHHYTIDSHEVQVLTAQYGWNDEGIAFYSSEAQAVAVYRQFNPGLTIGSHHFTTSKEEYDINNAHNGWQGEGIAWYAAAGGQPAATAEAEQVDCTQVKCVAFTFDDGPTRVHTPRVLDILREHGVRATFFVIGQNAAQHPGLIAREIVEGHAVGGHSWSHPFLTELTAGQIRSEIEKTDAAITAALGYGATMAWVPEGMEASEGQLHTLYMRPPYGAVNSTVYATMADLSKTSILWSIDTRDWEHRDAATALQKVRDQIKPGAIVLWHDLHPVAGQVLDQLIPELQAQGYHFVTIPELLGGQTAPGTSIRSLG